MIKVENLTKKFENITAVEDISFDIGESEIFGFLGPNGAGKTTTIRMLATLIPPTLGKITIDSRDSKENDKYVRSVIGILTESPGLYEKISAYENLDYYSSFYDIPDERRKKILRSILKCSGYGKEKMASQVHIPKG
ncbi:MAG: ABC transporter ATP-binding protein [Actinomycetota bacterium]|nr:ABC transporter ATP-binding protein [Actinomycetota bacterium]